MKRKNEAVSVNLDSCDESFNEVSTMKKRREEKDSDSEVEILYDNSLRRNSPLEDGFDYDSDATVENLPLANSDNSERKRTIRWADEVSKELEIVHILDDSDPAYRKARRGPWVVAAKKKRRRQKRIRRLSKIVSEK